MKRFALSIALALLCSTTLNGCWLDDIFQPKPQDQLHHVTFFNSGPYTKWVRCKNPDVPKQAGWYLLLAQTSPESGDGVASFDLKEKDHVIQFRDVNADTSTIERTINFHPDARDHQYTYDGLSDLDAYYDVATGETKYGARRVTGDR